MNLHGKKILITGGGTGIGLALADALAAKGAELLIAGRRGAPLAQAADRLRGGGATVHVAVADVTDAAGRTALIEAARVQLGGLDILIN
ncbi:MAG: SDR family NAD(P)-dependent oxidoreductase, partial [Rhodospirillaceae bacterium]|nr:SDR family NAD(P)-dependent oxidoreductase [Rhodospirillaceae bacterium]